MVIHHIETSIEVWVLVEGWTQFYISTAGRLKRIKGGQEEILHPYIGTKGYEAKKLHENGKGKHEFIHRLVAKAFIPNPENKLFVNHKNSNKRDNHVENLEWVTMEENNAHAMENGLMIKQKLNADQVIEMRRLHSEGRSAKSLAKEFGIGKSTAQRIVTNQAWKNI